MQIRPEDRVLFLTSILEEVKNAIIATDLDGTIIFWNKFAETLYQWKADEVIGRTFSEVMSTEMSMTLRQSDHWEGESVGKRRDGKRFPILFNYSIIRNGEGIAIGMISVSSDITEKKRFEEHLNAEKQRFRELIESVPFGMVIIDRDGTFRCHNPEFKELFGYEPSDVPNGKEWLTKVHKDPEYRHRVISAWGEDIKKVRVGERRPRTFNVTCKDGSRKIIHFVAVRLETGEDLLTCEDVTEMALAEELLRSSDEKYRALFEDSKDAIYMTTSDGRFIDINPASVELFGFASKEELLRIDIARDLYANPKDRKKFVTILNEKGFTKDYEIEFKRKNGERFIALATSTVVRDDKGGIRAYRGILRDVTEQRKLEQQLLQSQKIEAIGMLAGGVAHDFNNFLMVIQGNVELGLMNLDPSHPVYESLLKIKEGTEKASGLTRQLLAFGRRQLLNPKVLNVADMIGNLSRMLSRLIGEDIELRVELRPGLSPIYADPSAMDQVFMNLIVNARDTMPRGGVLTIQARNIRLDEKFCRQYPFVTPGEYVQISVIDTGKGINEKTMSRIFEPFFTTREKGSGLGLAVVYGIVEQHNGHIIVSSEVGQGSKFDVYLPVSKEPIIHEAVEADGKVLPRGNETILLAEDEREVRELFEGFLEGLGYKVLSASNGEEALRVFLTCRDEIDLVILDGVMPKLSGPEVYERIHTISPNISCLFLTGYSDDTVQRYSNQALKPMMLHKPITFQALSEKVREALDQAGKPSR